MDTSTLQLIDHLMEVLLPTPKLAVAFSGGVDSSTLLAAANMVQPGNVTAITAITPGTPLSDHEAESSVIDFLKVPWVRVNIDTLSIPQVRTNERDRCYHCKHAMFTKFIAIAESSGLGSLVEGSIVDDLGDHRPGMRAIQELGVRSPLIEAGLRKNDVREIARHLGLPVAERAPSPCLPTRLPYGTFVTEEKLRRIDEAENFLRALGISVVRVRDYGKVAKIEINPDDLPKILASMRGISDKLMGMGWEKVSLDENGYQKGRFDIAADSEKEKSVE